MTLNVSRLVSVGLRDPFSGVHDHRLIEVRVNWRFEKTIIMSFPNIGSSSNKNDVHEQVKLSTPSGKEMLTEVEFPNYYYYYLKIIYYYYYYY